MRSARCSPLALGLPPLLLAAVISGGASGAASREQRGGVAGVGPPDGAAYWTSWMLVFSTGASITIASGTPPEV